MYQGSGQIELSYYKYFFTVIEFKKNVLYQIKNMNTDINPVLNSFE